MDAFEQMYTEYSGDVLRFLLKLTGYNHTLAEELTQETFYRAFRSLYRFRGGCDIKTWLFQIAKNTFFNTLRAQRREANHHRAQSVPAASSPAHVAQLEERELVAQSLHILLGFAAPARDVMLYRFYSDLTYAQIAQTLGITESSAKVLFMRGKQKLADALRKEYGHEWEL